jgi:hypothetical protein
MGHTMRMTIYVCELRDSDPSPWLMTNRNDGLTESPSSNGDRLDKTNKEDKDRSCEWQDSIANNS